MAADGGERSSESFADFSERTLRHIRRIAGGESFRDMREASSALETKRSSQLLLLRHASSEWSQPLVQRSGERQES
jgi:hypothetical protein